MTLVAQSITAPEVTRNRSGQARHRAPRLGFLGVGHIGLNRLEAIAADGSAKIAVVADTTASAAESASAAHKHCRTAASLEDLLDEGVDGIVIATPSALHAQQCIAALERRVAVFCQKPLARNFAETRRVVDAARAADKLLGVDFSYRYTRGIAQIRQLIQSGELGDIYAADLVFHNAYGPDKPWFYNRNLSGGGCVIDLGIHLVDLALWMLNQTEVRSVSTQLFSGGQKVRAGAEAVEDFATAQLELPSGAVIRLACSWNLPAGRDAIIEASFYGTRGGAAFRNVNGSFYDFRAERFRGTSTETLVEPPDDWSGRAAVEWARQLAIDSSFDPAAEQLVAVARAIDAVYEAAR